MNTTDLITAPFDITKRGHKYIGYPTIGVLQRAINDDKLVVARPDTYTWSSTGTTLMTTLITDMLDRDGEPFTAELVLRDEQDHDDTVRYLASVTIVALADRAIITTEGAIDVGVVEAIALIA